MFDPVETISATNSTSLTQVQRIVAHMFDHPERVWWYAGDFMQPRLMNTHKHYVGYEASARLTDALTRFTRRASRSYSKPPRKKSSVWYALTGKLSESAWSCTRNWYE